MCVDWSYLAQDMTELSCLINMVMTSRCILNTKNTCAFKEQRLQSCFSPRKENEKEEELN